MRLEAVGELEIVVSHTVGAPRARVFEAWTRPELVARWLGPRSWRMERCEIDLRVGGAWLYLMRGSEGGQMLMEGEYREVVIPELLVTTERFDGGPNETINTITFTEHEGRTSVVCRVRFASRELRDRRLKTGMERGMREGYARLDALLLEQTITPGER